MVADILLAVLACLCFLVGLAGCVVPALPGPPISYIGLLLLHWTRFAEYSTGFLVIWAVIAVAVTALDNVLPVWITKRSGGSRAATIGSAIGLILGMFILPPAGIILGPFIGAFVGELIADHTDGGKAFKVALSSFAAFMMGAGAKLVVAGLILFYGVREFFI